eukprot:scaffold542128_cov18-Prasinocladus_malaysianus.AAC.1
MHDVAWRMGSPLVLSNGGTPAKEFGASASLTDFMSWPLAARLGRARAKHMNPCMHAILNK